MSGRVRIAVTAVVAALAFPPAGEGAMCISLAVSPSTPRVAQLTRIALRTFIPVAPGVLQPWVIRRYPFRVEAVSAGGERSRIRVRPSRDPYVWRGVFGFPTAGRWHLRVTNFGPRYGFCGPVVRIRVRR